MKSNEEMYQSILSRRDAYRRKKERQLRIVRRTVPVAAVFCLSAVLGISYWRHLEKPPAIPVIPEESTAATVMTTETMQTVTTSAQSSSTTGSNPVTLITTTKSTQNTIASAMTETVQTKTETSTLTQKTTQSTVTELPVTTTLPVTTSSSKITTQTVTTTAQTQTEPILTTNSQAAQKPVDTTELTIPSGGQQGPGIGSETAATETELPVPPAAQPIGYGGTEGVLEALHFCNVTGFPEEQAKAYLQMYYRIRQDGFIYLVTDTDEIKVKPDWAVILFPYAQYEDIGIGYYTAFGEKSFQVMFYCADEQYLSGSDDISAYLEKRTGRKPDREITVQNRKICINELGGRTMTADGFIDSEHYVHIVVLDTNEDEMLQIVNGLRYEKLDLSLE